MRQCCHPTGGTVHLGSLIKSAAFGKGIAEDVRGRIPWYRHDWVDGYSYGIRRVIFHQCSFLSLLCASASCFLLTSFLLSRLLAPATYIFFASVIPALAFGQQLFIATGALSPTELPHEVYTPHQTWPASYGCSVFTVHADGQLSGVQVLVATAITGTVQALVGGQPLLIIGVAEPIVLIYSFMYSFAKGPRRIGHCKERCMPTT